MDDILRFPSAVKHDPAIDVWLRAQRDDPVAVCAASSVKLWSTS